MASHFSSASSDPLRQQPAGAAATSVDYSYSSNASQSSPARPAVASGFAPILSHNANPDTHAYDPATQENASSHRHDHHQQQQHLPAGSGPDDDRTASPGPRVGIVSSNQSPAQSPANPLARFYNNPVNVELVVQGARWAASDLMVRFSGRTSDLDIIPSGNFANERAYRDMERLGAYLIKAYPCSIAPPLPPVPAHPPARALDRYYLTSLEQYLTRIAGHPVFSRDSGVAAFLSSPAAFEPPIPNAHSTTGDLPRVPSPSWSDRLRALVSSGPKDVDSEMEKRKEKTAEREFVLKQAQKTLDRLSASHRALASAYSDVAVKATAMGAAAGTAALTAAAVSGTPTSSTAQAATAHGASGPLGKMWVMLGKRLTHAADIYNEHAQMELNGMSDSLTLNLRACSNAQSSLEHRLHVLDLYDDSCRNTEKQKRKMEKLRAGGSIQEHKVTDALAKLDIVRDHEHAMRAQFRAASDIIVREWEDSELYHVADTRMMVDRWGKTQVDAERAVTVDVWGALRSTIA